MSTPPTRLGAALALFAMSACTDKYDPDANLPPVVSIDSHADGVAFQEGYLTTVTAAISDENSLPSEWTVSWFIGTEEVCLDTPGGTTVSCEFRPQIDQQDITINVRDHELAAASDSLLFTVSPTIAPSAEITQPKSDDKLYGNYPIPLEGLISDTEDAPSDLTVSWTSSVDGDLALSPVPDEDGVISDEYTLTEGNHTLTLTVEDLSAKTAIDTVDIVVGPTNSPPTCSLTEPVDNDAIEHQMEVTFVGQADDVDIDNDTLTVEWSSDIDGVIGTINPTPTGDIRFPYSGLSINTHLVTMTVLDERGESCQSTVTLQIGTPPEITISEPADGAILNDDAPITLSATVTDVKDSAEDLLFDWASDIDGGLGSGSVDPSGTARIDVESLSLGNHTLTLTATDTDGLENTASVTITHNGLPTAPTVSIDPATPYTSNDLTALLDVVSTDPEGDTITYTYTWTVDGTLSSTHTTETVAGSDTTKGEVWEVTVTPADPYGSGVAGIASTTILNSSPILSSVTVSPNSGVTTSTELTCGYSATDADDDTLTAAFQWTDSSGTILGSTDVLTLTAETVQPNEVVTCEVTVDDGDGGTAVMDNTITVDNTDPVIDSLTITPATGITTSTTLICEAVVSDADGETPTVSYVWTDGAGTTLGATDTLILSPARQTPGDVITCEVIASDAFGGSVSQSTDVTVENTPPTIDSVSISPDTGVTTSSVLTCTAIASDDDGGTPTISYMWTDPSGAVLGSAGTLTLTPTTVSPADEVTCTATASDIHGGSSLDSATVTVENTVPTVDSLSITPNTGVRTHHSGVSSDRVR